MFSTFLGGSNGDGGLSVHLDDERQRVFVLGRTASTNFPITSGARSNPNTADDMVVAEFTYSGK